MGILRKPFRKARRVLWQIARRLRKTLTVRTRQGLLTVYSADTVIGKSLYVRGEYELDWVGQVTDLLREHGRAPDGSRGVVLDIGANMGVISIGMLLAGRMDRAIAVEPDPGNVALLRKNVLQNGLDDRIVCLPFAASDREGTLRFELSADNYGDHRIRVGPPPREGGERYRESSRTVIEVPSERLDTLMDKVSPAFLNDLALVWIDVQGHEGHVFLGGERLFRRDIPVQAEIWPYGIRRAGMEDARFCEVAAGYWPYFWRPEPERLVRHPISDLPALFAELGGGNRSANVVFSRF